MTEPSGLIFLDNPERFKEILHIDDQKDRFAAFSTLDDAVICEVIRYGLFNDEKMIVPLRAIYEQHVLPGSEEWRYSIFQHIKNLVDPRIISTNALLPFIAEETSRRIVSTAVIDYVSVGPLTKGDPMSRVRDIVGMIESGFLENDGAAFGALLNLGDQRVCRLILPLRDTLDHAAVQEAINCSTGFVYAATVNFYLDWLEGFDGKYDDGLFGLVAAGLAQIRKFSKIDVAMTGQRPFPMCDVTHEELQALSKPVPLSDFVRAIAPRMHTLERAEPPPRVMPHVVAAWGLSPVTPISEAAELGDRSPVSPGQPMLRQVTTIKGEWWDGEYQVHVIWGILNPNGPTLYCVGSRFDAGKRVGFYRMLHFLGGETTFLPPSSEPMTYGSIFKDVAAIHNHRLDCNELGILQVIPSFLITQAGDPQTLEIVGDMITHSALSALDWGRTLAYQRQFGTDFFGWAGAEIRAFYEHKVAEARAAGRDPSTEIELIRARHADLPQFTEATIPSWSPSTLTPELLSEWLSVIATPEHAQAAMSTLRVMWEGSSRLMPDNMKPSFVEWDAVADFLVKADFQFPTKRV